MVTTIIFIYCTVFQTKYIVLIFVYLSQKLVILSSWESYF